jgi:hypothetical protein
MQWKGAKLNLLPGCQLTTSKGTSLEASLTVIAVSVLERWGPTQREHEQVCVWVLMVTASRSSIMLDMTDELGAGLACRQIVPPFEWWTRIHPFSTSD